MANHPFANYSFAYSLVYTVMEKYSDNFYLETLSRDIEFFSTPQLDAALMTILERRAIELFFLFSNEFASKGLSLDAFMDISEAMRFDFTVDSFNAKGIIWFSIIIAYYSAMASNRGVFNAPFCAISVITDCLDHYRETGELSDDIWPEMEQAAITIAKCP